MTDQTKSRRPLAARARPLAWGSAASLILAPLFALKWSGQIDWEVGDLMFAAVMIGAVGLAFELATRTRSSAACRAGTAVGVAAAFLLTWGNLAVGFVGSEDNPLNVLYFGVVGVAAGGAVIARFRPAGLAAAMAAAAAAQLAAGAIALANDAFTGPLTVFFTGLWCASAWLFRRAAEENRRSIAA